MEFHGSPRAPLTRVFFGAPRGPEKHTRYQKHTRYLLSLYMCFESICCLKTTDMKELPSKGYPCRKCDRWIPKYGRDFVGRREPRNWWWCSVCRQTNIEKPLKQNVNGDIRKYFIRAERK